MVDDEAEGVAGNNGVEPNRRILKVRLRQDHVIRLHELRILQGKSIAALLEGILDDYFRKQEPSSTSTFHSQQEAARRDEASHEAT